jgi:uncharacterized membrane protein YidH (DUF202 family)
MVQLLTDTLSRKPLLGIVGSFISVGMSANEVIEFIGLCLGLFIAIITAIIKVYDLIDRIREKRRVKRHQKRKVNSDED